MSSCVWEKIPDKCDVCFEETPSYSFKKRTFITKQTRFVCEKCIKTITEHSNVCLKKTIF